MKSVSGKHLSKLLRKQGWTLNRISGSHHIYDPPENLAHLKSVSVPVHGNRDLRAGTQSAIMKAASIKPEDL